MSTMSADPMPRAHAAAPHGPEGQGLPEPELLGLPAGYLQQRRNLTLDPNRHDDAYWSPWRIAESTKYQRHVYLWAASLIRRRGLASVLDVGCGVATKLEQLIVPTGAAVVGVDQASAIDSCRRLGRSARLIEADLERPGPLAEGPFDLVICADVLEHLLDPRPAMRLIRSCMHEGSLALLSTPDRDRRRGRACMRSDKPEHVREWTCREFRRFVRASGLRVLAARLMPQDDAPRRRALPGEVAFRLRMRDRSLLACHAVLCSRSTD